LEGGFTNLLDDPAVAAIVNNYRDVTDKHRAEQEREAHLGLLQEAYRVNDSLGAASLALAESLDLDTVLDTFLAHLERLIPYDSANVMLRDGSAFTIRAWRGLGQWANAPSQIGLRFDSADNPVVQQFLAGAVTIIPDTRQVRGWQRPSGAEHVISWMGVPIVAGGQMIGLYSVDKAEPNFFTEEHRRLAEALAGPAGVAIQNALLHESHVASERRFRSLIENSADAIALLDRKGKILYGSPSATRMLGYPRGSMIGHPGFEIIHPDDVEPVRRRLEESLQKPGAHVPIEARFRHSDGTYRHVEGLLTNLLQDSAVAAVVMNYNDVTETDVAQAAFRRSEERFRTLTVSSPLVVFETNAAGQCTYVSPRWSDLFGVPVDRALGVGWLDLVHPDDRARIMREWQQAAGVEEEGAYEYRINRLDGQVRWARGVARAVRSPEGAILGYVGTVEDITERKRAEDELRVSRERFFTLFRSSPSPTGVGTHDGRFIEVNDRYVEFFGYTRDELMSRTVHDLQLWVNPAERAGVIEKLKKEGSVRNYEASFRRKDGEIRTALLTMEPFEALGADTIIAMLVDITDRKRAAEALRQSEIKFRALSESAGSAIMISQGDHVVYANAAAEQIAGCTRQELMGMDFWQLVHPDFRETVRQRREARLRGEETNLRYEFKIRNVKNEERWVDFTATVVEWEGKPAILGTAFDVTERRRLEEQLRQSQKMEAVGRLAGGVAHDFNNLLGVIIGYSELLLESLPSGDQKTRGRIEEVHKAGQRAASLTRQLLAFSRQQVLEPHLLNLNAVVGDMEKLLRRLIGEDIELVTGLDPALGTVRADPGQLEQVIMNLAVNARDAMPKGGRVAIQTTNVDLSEQISYQGFTILPGRYVLLSVTDSGRGMDAETQRRIFEPFFTTKELGKGTGLGLATVYGIVKQSEGYIHVYSEPGHGATFKVYLPRVDVTAREARVEKPAESLRGTETVLVVEDEESLRELVVTVLEQNGYNVIAAERPAAALEAAARIGEPIHLLLTDVVLPGMSGRELAEKLLAQRKDLKVLYVSGYTDDIITHHGVLEPGIAFLQKPFSRESLLVKVREVLGKAPR
jgi:two-component system cell cycle sensor histidine kinase/response regulator CckA